MPVYRYILKENDRELDQWLRWIGSWGTVVWLNRRPAGAYEIVVAVGAAYLLREWWEVTRLRLGHWWARQDERWYYFRENTKTRWQAWKLEQRTRAERLRTYIHERRLPPR